MILLEIDRLKNLPKIGGTAPVGQWEKVTLFNGATALMQVMTCKTEGRWLFWVAESAQNGELCSTYVELRGFLDLIWGMGLSLGEMPLYGPGGYQTSEQWRLREAARKAAEMAAWEARQ